MKQSLSSPWLGDVTMELQDFSDGGCVVQIRMLGEEYFEGNNLLHEFLFGVYPCVWHCLPMSLILKENLPTLTDGTRTPRADLVSCINRKVWQPT